MAIPMFTGPVPPESERWCVVCAFTFKAACLAYLDNRVKEIMADPDAVKLVWMDLGQVAREHKIPFPHPGVALGMYGPTPQLGILELCWSHLQGIELKTSGVMPATMMPGKGGMGTGQVAGGLGG
jgi:hypothetical protein